MDIPPSHEGRRAAARFGDDGRAAHGLCAARGLMLLAAVGSLLACDRGSDIASRTTLSGSVNGSVITGRVSSTIDAGRGGRSTCEFDELPPSFTPGTFGTHT